MERKEEKKGYGGRITHQASLFYTEEQRLRNRPCSSQPSPSPSLSLLLSCSSRCGLFACQLAVVVVPRPAQPASLLGFSNTLSQRII